MSRSAYATVSALSVACPRCKAAIGKSCRRLVTDSINYVRPTLVQVDCKRSHSERREAADEQRTREVQAKISALPQDVHEELFEIPPEIPLREYPPLRAPDLCPDDDLSFLTAPSAPETPRSIQYHKDGTVRPPYCRCEAECWTDEMDAEWRKEWRESE